MFKGYRIVVAASVVAVLGAACGQDKGADVRNVGPTGTAGTASGTGTGTGAASATGTHAAAECKPFGDEAGATSTVAVKLQEWAVLPAVTQTAAGKVHFEIENTGKQPHELLVAKADDPSALPTDEKGAFDEAAYGEDKVLGEVEGFPGGQKCEGTFDMAPGDYVLLCNIVEEHDGKVESHYQMGMRTAFKVT